MLVCRVCLATSFTIQKPEKTLQSFFGMIHLGKKTSVFVKSPSFLIASPTPTRFHQMAGTGKNKSRPKQKVTNSYPRVWPFLRTTLLKTNITPQKIDGWKTILSSWVLAYFHGRLLLVSGKVYNHMFFSSLHWGSNQWNVGLGGPALGGDEGWFWDV